MEFNCFLDHGNGHYQIIEKLSNLSILCYCFHFRKNLMHSNINVMVLCILIRDSNHWQTFDWGIERTVVAILESLRVIIMDFEIHLYLN